MTWSRGIMLRPRYDQMETRLKVGKPGSIVSCKLCFPKVGEPGSIVRCKPCVFPESAWASQETSHFPAILFRCVGKRECIQGDIVISPNSSSIMFLGCHGR